MKGVIDQSKVTVNTTPQSLFYIFFLTQNSIFVNVRRSVFIVLLNRCFNLTVNTIYIFLYNLRL